MKIRELIELLEIYDSELEVIVYNSGHEDGGLAHDSFAEEVYTTSYEIKKYPATKHRYEFSEVWVDDSYENDCVIIR